MEVADSLVPQHILGGINGCRRNDLVFFALPLRLNTAEVLMHHAWSNHILRGNIA